MIHFRVFQVLEYCVAISLFAICWTPGLDAQTEYFDGHPARETATNAYGVPAFDEQFGSESCPECELVSGHSQLHVPGKSRFRFTEINIYPTFSMLDDVTGYYTEFEFASHTEFGRWEMENRTVMNVADLPGTIKLGAANPGDVPVSADIRGNGFGDILSGFFFSRKNHQRKSHFGVGPVVTMPTASNDLLGSSQWTIGPGAHFSTEIGRLTTGFFLWQSWGLTDDPAKKRVNQLFGKPFLIYELNEKWNLVYVPLGLSHSWKSTPGEDWTVPIGGGIRRLCEVRGQKMGLQFQVFDYVSRKPTDPEWEYRFTIEFLFD